MSAHYVSPSALTEFRKCPKCFWIDRNKKIKKPRGAFPTLPGGMDRVLKAYFDGHRAKQTLPPEIAHVMPISTILYPDIEKLKLMRNALRPLLACAIGNVKLVGGIDDLLVDAQGRVSVFDYKTKGNLIKDDKDPFEYYRMQMNDYGLLLEAGGFTLTGIAYLGYWSPDRVMSEDVYEGAPAGQRTPVDMACQVFSMKIDTQAAIDEVVAAGKCLDGDLPPSAPSCETCQFIAARGSG